MEEEEPMRLNLACIYHYVKLAYFSYAYTAPGMFFADLSHNEIFSIYVIDSIIEDVSQMYSYRRGFPELFIYDIY